MQARIDQLCDLASRPNTTRADIEQFINIELEEKLDINDRHTVTDLRPIEVAAQTGSFSTFEYLLIVRHANITAGNSGNLMDMASRRESMPAIKQYIFDHELWKQFRDGTTELHVLAWMGKTREVITLLDDPTNPDRIVERNKKNKSVLYWANVSNNKDTLDQVATRADSYIERNKEQKNWINIREYSICLATVVLRQNFDSAIKFFQAALEAHTEVITIHDDKPDYLINAYAIRNNIYRSIADAYIQYAVYSTKKIQSQYKQDLEITSTLVEVKNNFELPLSHLKDAVKTVNRIMIRVASDTLILAQCKAHEAAVYIARGAIHKDRAEKFAKDNNHILLAVTELEVCIELCKDAEKLINEVLDYKQELGDDFPDNFENMIKRYTTQLENIRQSAIEKKEFLKPTSVTDINQLTRASTSPSHLRSLLNPKTTSPPKTMSTPTTSTTALRPKPTSARTNLFGTVPSNTSTTSPSSQSTDKTTPVPRYTSSDSGSSSST